MVFHEEPSLPPLHTSLLLSPHCHHCSFIATFSIPLSLVTSSLCCYVLVGIFLIMEEPFFARPQLSSPVFFFFFPNPPLKPCHKPSHTTLICAGDSKGMFVWWVLGGWSKVGPDPAVGYTVPRAR